MIAMYDSEENRVVLLAFPEELEGLAQQMRHKESDARLGDKTTTISLPVRNYWDSQPVDMRMDIGYLQKSKF